MVDVLRALQQRLAAFAAARDWEQFHSPKNLAMALSVEASELVEEFQWLTEEQSQALDAERRERVRLELADVFIYLLRLADRLDVDLLRAADDKIAQNERKYPAERVRGDSRKYTEYDVTGRRATRAAGALRARRARAARCRTAARRTARSRSGRCVASPRCEPRVRTIGPV